MKDAIKVIYGVFLHDVETMNREHLNGAFGPAFAVGVGGGTVQHSLKNLQKGIDEAHEMLIKYRTYQ